MSELKIKALETDEILKRVGFTYHYYYNKILIVGGKSLSLDTSFSIIEYENNSRYCRLTAKSDIRNRICK